MIGKLFNSRLFFLIISIVFAIFLFFNANNNNQNRKSTNTGGQIYSTMLKNLPINIRYDQKSYFISGYVSSANVNLTSYNQIKLLQEESSDLRTLTLSSNLTGLGIGTHEVPIKVTNLPKVINAQITPNAMSVTIENKVKQKFQVTPVIDDKLIPSGYTIDTVATSPNSVIVTAGTDSIKNISKIEAILPSNVDLHEDYSGQINLIAVDSNGHVVPAMLSRSSVRLTVKVHKPATTGSSKN